MAHPSIKSFAISVGLMLAVVFSCGSARATASFEFALSGQLEAPDGLGQDHTYPWSGHLVVVLASGADGTYDNTDLQSFKLVSTVATFLEPSFTPIPFIATFTVANGKLTAIDAAYYDPVIPDIVTHFGGLTVTYYQPLIYRDPQTTGTATLTAVPEPGAGAMLLFGLALGVAGRRFNRQRHVRRAPRL